MKIEDADFNGLRLVHSFNPFDNRGQFVKVFNREFFNDNNLDFDISEGYYSVSHKNVIRGMHFQLPPEDHIKLVYVSYGEIVDVCVDLRKNSSSFGKVYSRNLSSKNNIAIYISKGFAHGFETISDTAIVHYLQTTGYSKEHDYGILWNSIPHKWNSQHPIISDRDRGFLKLDEFLNSDLNSF